MNKLAIEKRTEVISALVKGNSLRNTVRMTGVAMNTIQKLLADLGTACAEYQAKAMRNLNCKHIECVMLLTSVPKCRINLTAQLAASRRLRLTLSVRPSAVFPIAAPTFAMLARSIGGTMHVKDKQYLANVFERISASVKTVNEKIIAHRKNQVTVQDLHAAVALEQLAMQHETLIILATLVADPSLASEPLPEPPKKIIGFN